LPVRGYLALLLHAHLPYVRHPEMDEFLEEDWLFEAITETYVPLADMMEGLVQDGVPFRLTISITPTLASMLSDELLQNRYRRHLNRLIELAYRELDRTRYQPQFHSLAQMYVDRFERVRHLYKNRYKCNLLTPFRQLQDAGYIEIIASAATHGYLPLMEMYPEAVRAQVATGVRNYMRFFGKKPKGFWLPECGYTPVVDDILAEFDIAYFVLDSHGILHARPRPKYAVYAPVFTPSAVAAFGRDWESSKQVWSADEGYPGDFEYREFYRDIGYDLDYDYIRPYIKTDHRTNTGIKYYRITGKTGDKEPYRPQSAGHKASVHAGNFMFNRERQIEYLSQHMDRPPIVLAPYDAELFGHWWFEGPWWLNYLIRKTAYDQNVFSLITPDQYLQEYQRNQVASPSPSSWGYRGYNEVWLDGSNNWIYRHLHKATQRMIELASEYPLPERTPSDLTRRALNQAARELLLAQSSDWAFIMKTGTMAAYAAKRTKQHVSHFTDLYNQIKSGSIDEDKLKELEYRDNIFPDIDYQTYRTDRLPASRSRQTVSIS